MSLLWKCKNKLLSHVSFKIKIKNNDMFLHASTFNCCVQYLCYKNVSSLLLVKTYENCNAARGISIYSKNYDIEEKKAEKQYLEHNMTKKDISKIKIESGPGLAYFVSKSNSTRQLTKRELKQISHPYIPVGDLNGHGQNVFFEVHGCQMNVNDTEIAWSILQAHGYSLVHTPNNAHIILIMTCAIREGAETKIWEKLKNMRHLKKNKNVKIGILGCMAERLKSELIEKEDSVDIVAGPDSYKDLPRLLAIAESGEKSLNVLLSHDETYANIKPVSISSDRVSAFVSIMRGCDNLCTYCIVPYTRGRERSRDINSIIKEIAHLSDQGIKEIVLLGQNVNSYRDTSEVNFSPYDYTDTQIWADAHLAKGFKEKYKNKVGGRRFADLLDKVSLVNPEMRIRFTSPHPKDFPDEVLHIINERPNICKSLHLPAQSGNSRILELMKRGYTREAYLELVLHIRSIIPTINLSSDFICGFCGETEEEFEETISMLQKVQYSFCYIFPYSMREKTAAHRNLDDTVSRQAKVDRVTRLHNLFREIALQLNSLQIGKHHLVLVEGFSKRSKMHLAGRNDGNVKVIIPDIEIEDMNSGEYRRARPGDYVDVRVNSATSQSMTATPVKISSIKQFFL